MRLDNCLKMIREEQDTPRGWTIRFNDLSNTIVTVLVVQIMTKLFLTL